MNDVMETMLRKMLLDTNKAFEDVGRHMGGLIERTHATERRVYELEKRLVQLEEAKRLAEVSDFNGGDDA